MCGAKGYVFFQPFWSEIGCGLCTLVMNWVCASDREPNCRFCKKSLISGKRINAVPVFGVSRNKTLLVDSGQDSVVLAQAFESSRFPLEQGESFSD